MNPNGNNADLDPDEQKALKTTALDAGELGRTFEFRGIALKPFSYHHCFCFWRFERSKFVFENAALLLYLLTLEPEKVAAIRNEAQMDAARAASFEWIRTFSANPRAPMVDEATAKDAIDTFNAIEEDYAKATSVEPPKGGALSPNASAPAGAYGTQSGSLRRRKAHTT